MFLEILVLQRTACFIQAEVIFVSIIGTVCQPFNTWCLKTVTLSQKLISAGATVSFGHRFKGLKSSRRAYLYH